VLVLFLPQYLEYFGIFAFVIMMSILITYPIIKYFIKNKLDEYFEREAEKLKKLIKLHLKF
jgi:hypothetical protein